MKDSNRAMVIILVWTVALWILSLFVTNRLDVYVLSEEYLLKERAELLVANPTNPEYKQDVVGFNAMVKIYNRQNLFSRDVEPIP